MGQTPPGNPATPATPDDVEPGVAGDVPCAQPEQEAQPGGADHAPAAVGSETAGQPDAVEPTGRPDAVEPTGQPGAVEPTGQPDAAGPAEAGTGPQRLALPRLPVLLGAGAAVLLALIWGGAAWATTQHVFPGSTVSGVDVGGMSPDQATHAVTDSLGPGLTEPVTLTVDQREDSLVPADSGVSIDAEASVGALTSFTLNPVTIVGRLTGEEVGAVVAVDETALTSALNARLGTLASGTRDATVTLDGTTPVLTPGSTGTGLDVATAVTELASRWPLGESSIELPAGTAAPAVTDAEAQALVDDVLTPLLSADVTVTTAGTAAEQVTGGASATLTPAQLAAATVISADGGVLSATLDPTSVHDAVLAALPAGVEQDATDATWTIEGTADATPQYVPPADGRTVDADALATSVLDAGTSGAGADGTAPSHTASGPGAQRSVALPVAVDTPEVTTAEADWGMTQVIGEYTTPYASEYGRDQNLVTGTSHVNGQVVMAGATFSLSDALGPVDEEHGYAYAGVVTDGQHTDAMGGGLSQVGTTVFNAGFEAGMDDTEHHPHSFWFTRYPAGRDATMWTGVLDVKFTNSTPGAVLLQAWAADGEVHVRVWGTPYYTVSIDNGTPHSYRAYTAVRDTSASCVPYGGGAQGFDITVTRSRTTPDGTRVADDVLNVSYASDNPVVCG